jgi:hypothetical protein
MRDDGCGAVHPVPYPDRSGRDHRPRGTVERVRARPCPTGVPRVEAGLFALGHLPCGRLPRPLRPAERSAGDGHRRPTSVGCRWRANPVDQRIFPRCRDFWGHPDRAVALSRRPPRRCPMQARLQARLVPLSLHGEPPSPSTGAFRAYVRMHRPLTSTFGSAACRLWGEFVGSYSTPAWGNKAARQGTGGPTRCEFAHRGGRRASAAQGMPYAALCSCTTQRRSECSLPRKR